MPVTFSSNFVTLPGQYLTTASASTDDYFVASSALIVTATNDMDAITGLAADLPPDGSFPSDGTLLFVINASPVNTVIIPSNSASSTVGNRFQLAPFTTLTLAPNHAQLFFLVPDGPAPGWYPYIPGVLS